MSTVAGAALDPRFAVSTPSYKASTRELAEPFPAEVEEVFKNLEALESNGGLCMPGEPTPTGENIAWAKDVLLRVLPRKFLVGAQIDPFREEIHVSWEGETKRVVAFLPRPNELKVYKESIQNNVGVNPTLVAATTAALCEALGWFFQK